jgi:hypothetical protein
MQSTQYTGIVEDFGRKLEVGTRELVCVVEKWHLEVVEPANAKKVVDAETWLSAEVPGREAKVVLAGELNSQRARMERFVVDYRVQKREP